MNLKFRRFLLWKMAEFSLTEVGLGPYNIGL